jgi:hypothetical protein
MTPTAKSKGVSVAKARRILLGSSGVEEGRSYGLPSFLLGGRFFARFRDDDTVLVLQIASIAEREILIQLDPDAFFFTEHYRDYPAVLIRLAAVPEGLLASVIQETHLHAASMPARRRARKRR